MHHGISHRSVCALIGVARSFLGYESVREEKDAPVIEVMREETRQHPRYGYRRIRIFLRPEGYEMSADRCHWLWRKAGLQVPRRRPRRRVAGSGVRPISPVTYNHIWAYDFITDACANGQKLKYLAVVDEYTRECLAIEVAGSIRSARVIEVLSRLISVHGAPRYLRCDNGPEFVSRVILEWVVGSGINTAHIDPGKPWQNGADESFNGKFRDRCLSMEWFRSREEAKAIIETWRRHYNAVCPRSSRGYQTPNEFKATIKQSTRPKAIS